VKDSETPKKKLTNDSETAVKHDEETKSAPVNKADGDYITFRIPQIALTTPVAIIIAAIILAVGIGSGLYFGLGAQGAKTTTTTGTNNGTNADPLALENFPETTVNVRNNRAVSGDLNKAKVVIVEFTDYMCVFCRQFVTGISVQTNQKTGPGAYEEIKTKYVDTGKVAHVYKNLPLSIHEPAATEVAYLAECVRREGGMAAYQIFHDQVFLQLDKLQKSGTTGLDYDKAVMGAIIAQTGTNAARVNSCATNKEMKGLVDEDVQDVTALQTNLASWLQSQGIGGIGTPGFVIGKLQKDGTVKGRFIGGAYPFQAFQNVIEEQLKK
jgi:protein-disulfide isomerase